MVIPMWSNPMTREHIDKIIQSRTMADKIIVLVCGYQNECFYIDFDTRYKLTQETLYDANLHNPDTCNSLVYVHKVDVSYLVESKDSFTEKFTLFDNQIKEIINEQFPVNDGIEYTIGIAGRWTDRSLRTIKNKFNIYLFKGKFECYATSGKADPANFKYICRKFRPWYTHKILITGTASEGKTTLVQDLGNYFGFPIVREEGRIIMDKLGKTDKELDVTDFIKFMQAQKQSIEDACENSNGTIIVDTDSLVTMMYATAYADIDECNISEDDLITLKRLLPQYLNIKYGTWNRIFVLTPNEDFSDDGTRYMKQSSLEEREKNFKILKELHKKYYNYDVLDCYTTYLKGSQYMKNFNTVKTYIEQMGLA